MRYCWRASYRTREIEPASGYIGFTPTPRNTPPANVELAIEGIVTLLRGEGSDFATSRSI